MVAKIRRILMISPDEGTSWEGMTSADRWRARRTS
jgi:hypothetical protein